MVDYLAQLGGEVLVAVYTCRPLLQLVSCVDAATQQPVPLCRCCSPEYAALKAERSEILWKGVEKIIPDIRQRAEVSLWNGRDACCYAHMCAVPSGWW